jgi:hypothetical protein
MLNLKKRGKMLQNPRHFSFENPFTIPRFSRSWHSLICAVFQIKIGKIYFFLFKINLFYIFKLFWYADIKNNFLKIKKYIILMYLQVKNTLKNNYYYTFKHSY